MEKAKQYAKRLACLKRQVRNSIVKTMRDSGVEEVSLLPKKSRDRVWVVFFDDFIEEYKSGYLDRIKYHAGNLSFEIIWGEGGVTELSEKCYPLFMDIPEIMIRIYKRLLKKLEIV